MIHLSDCDPLSLASAIVRLTLGCLLLLAGSLKWLNGSKSDPVATMLGLSSNRLLATAISSLPIVEIILGAWLFLGWWILAALAITTLLLISFTVFLIIAVRRGYKGGCACFGSVDGYQIGLVQFVRNTLLIIAAIFAGAQCFISPCASLPVWKLPLFILPTTVAVLVTVSAVYIMAAEMDDFFKRIIGRSILK